LPKGEEGEKRAGSIVKVPSKPMITRESRVAFRIPGVTNSFRRIIIFFKGLSARPKAFRGDLRGKGGGGHDSPGSSNSKEAR